MNIHEVNAEKEQREKQESSPLWYSWLWLLFQRNNKNLCSYRKRLLWGRVEGFGLRLFCWVLVKFERRLRVRRFSLTSVSLNWSSSFNDWMHSIEDASGLPRAGGHVQLSKFIERCHFDIRYVLMFQDISRDASLSIGSHVVSKTFATVHAAFNMMI